MLLGKNRTPDSRLGMSRGIARVKDGGAHHLPGVLPALDRARRRRGIPGALAAFPEQWNARPRPRVKQKSWASRTHGVIFSRLERPVVESRGSLSSGGRSGARSPAHLPFLPPLLSLGPSSRLLHVEGSRGTSRRGTEGQGPGRACRSGVQRACPGRSGPLGCRPAPRVRRACRSSAPTERTSGSSPAAPAPR